MILRSLSCFAFIQVFKLILILSLVSDQVARILLIVVIDDEVTAASPIHWIVVLAILSLRRQNKLLIKEAFWNIGVTDDDKAKEHLWALLCLEPISAAIMCIVCKVDTRTISTIFVGIAHIKSHLLSHDFKRIMRWCAMEKHSYHRPQWLLRIFLLDNLQFIQKAHLNCLILYFFDLNNGILFVPNRCFKTMSHKLSLNWF